MASVRIRSQEEKEKARADREKVRAEHKYHDDIEKRGEGIAQLKARDTKVWLKNKERELDEIIQAPDAVR